MQLRDVEDRRLLAHGSGHLQYKRRHLQYKRRKHAYFAFGTRYFDSLQELTRNCCASKDKEERGACAAQPALQAGVQQE